MVVKFKGNSTIPSSSIISQTLFGIILSDILIKITNFDLSKYKQNHPAGNIGHLNKTIQDVMLVDFPLYRLIDNSFHDINTIKNLMNKYDMGICLFVDENNEFQGIITDGDIRRNSDLFKINNNCYTEHDLTIKLFKLKKYQYIPIVDENKKLLGLVKMI